MKLTIWTLVTLFISSICSSYAQEKHKVSIRINKTPKHAHIGDTLFITGTFNGWNVNNTPIGTIHSEPKEATYTILNCPRGVLEFKINRGSWKTLASTASGKLEGPLKVNIQSDTIIDVSVDAWRDDFPESTASEQVHLLDSVFFFPRLNAKRKVWIYLPKDYEVKNKRYPVLYIHDGQDVFDEATSRGRIGPLEWGVDEVIDLSGKKCIVVAIAQAENIQQRQNEYFVFPNKNFDSPKGMDYLQDIVESLKPYVDKHFKSLKEKEYTAMAGSSVAGLLTLYAGILYPDVFGTLGVFSPSLWLDENNIEKLLIHSNKIEVNSLHKENFFLYGGGNEKRTIKIDTHVQMGEDLKKIAGLLKRKSNSNIHVDINPHGGHGALYWKQAFPNFYSWWQDIIKESTRDDQTTASRHN